MRGVSLTTPEISAIESFGGEVLNTSARLQVNNHRLDLASFGEGNVLYCPPRIAQNIKISERKQPVVLLSFPDRKSWHNFAAAEVYSEKGTYRYPACSVSLSYFPQELKEDE